MCVFYNAQLFEITGAAKGVFTHPQSSCHIAKFMPYRKGCAHTQARQPSKPHSLTRGLSTPPAVSSLGGLRTPAPPCAPHYLHGAGIRKPSQTRKSVLTPIAHDDFAGVRARWIGNSMPSRQSAAIHARPSAFCAPEPHLIAGRCISQSIPGASSEIQPWNTGSGAQSPFSTGAVSRQPIHVAAIVA
jgi:hypothetical protein